MWGKRGNCRPARERDGDLPAGFKSSVKHAQHPAHEAAFFLPDEIKFSLIQPETVARETLIDQNIAEGNFFKLHSALRALHKVESTVSLPFLDQELGVPIPGQFPHAFGFLAGKVLVFPRTGPRAHI